MNTIAFIGFGEAACAFVTGWGDHRPKLLRGFDLKHDAQIQARFAALNVAQSTCAQAVSGADAVFCVVTADQALIAAENAAPHIEKDTLWFDCNSCAPQTKITAAKVINAAGGRYVDAAVMAPVHPLLHHVPILLSGPHAKAASTVLAALDMRANIAGDLIGQASSIKMMRSVMIKGLEALSAECFLAARKAGVDEAVIGSLEASNPEIQWREQGAYHLERMLVHGKRRAAEMREVARTVQDLGLSGGISAAVADWQDQLGHLEADPGENDLANRADRVLAQLEKQNPQQ